MSSLNPTKIAHNLDWLPPAGRLAQIRTSELAQWIELSKKLKAWREDPATQTAWVSQKRKATSRALAEFQDLYEASEYFAIFGQHDDSFEVYCRR